MKSLLQDMLAIAVLLALAILCAARAVGDDRAVWSGVQGRVIGKSTHVGRRFQANCLQLRTDEGTRDVHVGDATMAGCQPGDVLSRKPRSLLVTCRGETAVDWTGVIFAGLTVVWLVLSGVMIRAMAARRRGR
ncbi:MAG TPA: hypothetical protein VGQ83_29885 [Polyangia bacterium]|jgi:hypothetical protein